MNEIIFLVQEAVEGGFEAKALSASIYTEAETLDELKQMIRDAVACHFEDHEKPKIIRHSLCARRDHSRLNAAFTEGGQCG